MLFRLGRFRIFCARQFLLLLSAVKVKKETAKIQRRHIHLLCCFQCAKIDIFCELSKLFFNNLLCCIKIVASEGYGQAYQNVESDVVVAVPILVAQLFRQGEQVVGLQPQAPIFRERVTQRGV